MPLRSHFASLATRAGSAATRKPIGYQYVRREYDEEVVMGGGGMGGGGMGGGGMGGGGMGGMGGM